MTRRSLIGSALGGFLVLVCVFVGGMRYGKSRYECPPPDPALAAAADDQAEETAYWQAEAERLEARADSLGDVAVRARVQVDAVRPRYEAARAAALRPPLPLSTLTDDSLALSASRELYRRLAERDAR